MSLNSIVGGDSESEIFRLAETAFFSYQSCIIETQLTLIFTIANRVRRHRCNLRFPVNSFRSHSDSFTARFYYFEDSGSHCSPGRHRYPSVPLLQAIGNDQPVIKLNNDPPVTVNFRCVQPLFMLFTNRKYSR